MYLGRVIGTVTSTGRNGHPVGIKLLVVEELTRRLEREGTDEVTVGSMRVGTGEIVVVCKGNSARYVFGKNNTPMGTSTVSIVGMVEVGRWRVFIPRPEARAKPAW